MNKDQREASRDVILVSVLIPTRDRRQVLERCLDALTDQTYPNFEVIVVDDASRDDTLKFLKKYAAGHPPLRLRYLVNETHIGANRSRNRGIRAAEGVFVAFLDSDCRAERHWLETLIGGFTGPRVAAVTGTVQNPPPTNVYELTYRGTNRVCGSVYANRLSGGNMSVRRDLLLEHPLDEDLKYGCDEEGLYLRLRSAGYEQRLVPEAIVQHEHYFTRRTFFRQAHIGGKAAAWLVYKYHLPPRLDLLPFILAYGTLPLVALDYRLSPVPVLFLAAALAAITYNDLFRKRKTIGETVRSFPVLLAYYHVRLAGYVIEALRLRLGKHGIVRRRLPRRRTTASQPAARETTP